jgi:hypothetical protein
VDADKVRDFFKEAEKEHVTSQAKGRFVGMNSFNLLSFKLDQAIEPGGGKEAPCRGTAGRKHGRYAETGTRVNESTADSTAGPRTRDVTSRMP